MKKTIIFLLLTAMLLTTIIPLTAFSEEPNDYADHLVGYWDFAKYNRPLWDKGSKGIESNDLSVPTGVTIANSGSAAVIDNTAGEYYAIHMRNGADLGATQSLTIGFRVKVDKVSSSDTVLLNRVNCYQIRVQDSGASGYKLVWVNNGIYKPTVQTYNYCDIFGETTFSYGQEYFFFIVVKAGVVTIDSEEAVVNHITGYYSVDGKTFSDYTTNNVKIHNSYLTSANVKNNVFSSDYNGRNFWLGKSLATEVSGATLTFDTVWYYNTAVEKESLSTIVYKTHYATDNTAATTPTYRGLQLSPVVSNVFSMRLVGTVDSLNYAEVGFEVRITDYNGQSSAVSSIYTTNEVFKSLIATSNLGTNDSIGDGVVYTAADFGGEYLYAVTIQNIPTDAAVTFEISVYYKTLDGETHNGDTYKITVDGGRFVSQTIVS